jgi:hypothetical protein
MHASCIERDRCDVASESMAARELDETPESVFALSARRRSWIGYVAAIFSLSYPEA